MDTMLSKYYELSHVNNEISAIISQYFHNMLTDILPMIESLSNLLILQNLVLYLIESLLHYMDCNIRKKNVYLTPVNSSREGRKNNAWKRNSPIIGTTGRATLGRETILLLAIQEEQCLEEKQSCYWHNGKSNAWKRNSPHIGNL